MTDSELDRIYTHLCTVMTEVGEAGAPLLLARFALLAMHRIGDAATVEKLIADAADGLIVDRPTI